MTNSTFSILPILRAEKPHPAYADKLMLFGQFVGVWDMEISFFADNGEVNYHEAGMWYFSWILDGRAIQDVLTYPNPYDKTGERRIGTSIRQYDPQADRWRVVWLGAVSNVLVSLSGGRHGDGIQLEGIENDGTLNRWTFREITPTSFHWYGVISSDDGQTWRPVQEMVGQRRAAST